ncbi:MAG: hypothetical protein WAV05_08305 [Anaerolineales bacterium]
MSYLVCLLIYYRDSALGRLFGVIERNCFGKKFKSIQLIFVNPFGIDRKDNRKLFEPQKKPIETNAGWSGYSIGKEQMVYQDEAMVSNCHIM